MKRIKIILLGVSLVVTSTMLNAQDVFLEVKEDRYETVKTLIDKDPDLINAKDETRRTLLHWACRGQNQELIEYLILKGSEVNAQDYNGIAPIHSTVSRNYINSTKLLIKHGAEVSMIGYQNNTPLHYAAMDGHLELVELLIGKGASLEKTDNWGRTPLLVAVREQGGIEVVKTIVEGGANIHAVDKYGDTPLTLAAWRGFEEIVNYLLERKVGIPVKGQKGTDLVMFTLNKRLLKLYNAISDKAGDISSLLPSGIKPLHLAAKGGSYQIVLDLINKGHDINKPDLYGYFPLHYAAQYGRLDVVRLLCDKGAILNSKSFLGVTPFQLANRESKAQVADFLLSLGADNGIIQKSEIMGKYFGQAEPGQTPELFAPGIVSNTVGGHSNVVFSRGGDEAFWTEWNETESGYSDGGKIWHSKIEDGFWTVPEVLRKYGDTPVFSTDGTKIFFMDIAPSEEGVRDRNQIVYFNTDAESYKTPEILEFDLEESALYWQFTFDEDNNIYFGGRAGMRRSIYKNGKYLPSEKLSESFHPDYVGESPFIAQDGSYIIFASSELPHSFGEIDLYIGYLKDDGTWSDPINMGPTINTPEIELLPMISLDGKHLFFRSTKNNIMGMYWVSADIINRLRLK